MKRSTLAIVVATVLLLGGSALLISEIRSQATSFVSAPPTSHVAVASSQKNAISGNPVHLSIPSLDMSLDVTPGVYNVKTKTWTLTLDKVQYAVMTPEPNDLSGNTFFYGHYRRNVFARLHTVKAGAQAIVTTDNGHTFYYGLSSVRVTDPNDSASVFNYQGKPILTIQTCTGLFFQNRQLFTFDFEKVS